MLSQHGHRRQARLVLVVFELDIDPDAVLLGRCDRKAANRTDGLPVSSDYATGIVGMQTNTVEMPMLFDIMKNTGRLWMLDQLDDDIFQELLNREFWLHVSKTAGVLRSATYA